MTWQTPKVDWQPGDVVSDGDLNRIEGNLGMCGPAVVQDPGDLLVASGPQALQRLAVGAAGHVLTVVDGMPAWAPIVPDEYLTMWGM